MKKSLVTVLVLANIFAMSTFADEIVMGCQMLSYGSRSTFTLIKNGENDSYRLLKLVSGDNPKTSKNIFIETIDLGSCSIENNLDFSCSNFNDMYTMSQDETTKMHSLHLTTSYVETRTGRFRKDLTTLSAELNCTRDWTLDSITNGFSF